ncbi:MAG: isoprenylcysteine carboxylmethyltransferase family protein [Proteobacteria bacterium]|nr:isoprenylcysteine carboxylmethyltransferase family protein [Pseudomonadota bacterium]
MKDDIKDRAAIHTQPPLIFFACLGMGILLEYLFPFRFITGAWSLRIIIGCFLFLASGIMAVSAFIVLIKNKTPFNPAKPTEKIVCEGSFRFSRNPLYLALLLLSGGAAIVTGSVWLVLALLILFILLERFAIRPEEKYLTDKFGEDYLNYKASVRRWL